MDHQDWTPTIINGKNTKEKVAVKKEKLDKLARYVPPPETIKIEASSNLGPLICQARTSKGIKQKDLATKLPISVSILSRWETGKEIPTNADIAKIEKILCIKLPRNKKIKVDPN
jgi:ribosome-binding protein aMBF1 (putative translation factor)